jgi:hypothetical protein
MTDENPSQQLKAKSKKPEATERRRISGSSKLMLQSAEL